MDGRRFTGLILVVLGFSGVFPALLLLMDSLMPGPSPEELAMCKVVERRFSLGPDLLGPLLLVAIALAMVLGGVHLLERGEACGG